MLQSWNIHKYKDKEYKSTPILYILDEYKIAPFFKGLPKWSHGEEATTGKFKNSIISVSEKKLQWHRSQCH